MVPRRCRLATDRTPSHRGGTVATEPGTPWRAPEGPASRRQRRHRARPGNRAPAAGIGGRTARWSEGQTVATREDRTAGARGRVRGPGARLAREASAPGATRTVADHGPAGSAGRLRRGIGRRMDRLRQLRLSLTIMAGGGRGPARCVVGGGRG